jgi:hypothetical protein
MTGNHSLSPSGKYQYLCEETSLLEEGISFCCGECVLQLFSLGLKVLGRGEPWKGGDYMTEPGGGQKVRLLKAGLQEMEEDKVVLFIDR